MPGILAHIQYFKSNERFKSLMETLSFFMGIIFSFFKTALLVGFPYKKQNFEMDEN